MSFASFLAAPTIRIRLSATEYADEKTYTVHRSLLAGPNTTLLSSVRTRDTLLTLDGTRVSRAALEAVLEYLYTGLYTDPVPSGSHSDVDSNAETEVGSDHESHTAGREPAGHNAIISAAMKGGIGVWGKPAAIRKSSFGSELFPEVCGGLGPDGAEPELETLHVFYGRAPPSPSAVFGEYGPVLASNKHHAGKTAAAGAQLEEKSPLRLHTRVWVLARRYSVVGLESMALAKMLKMVESDWELLRDLVETAYGLDKGGLVLETIDAEELKRAVVRFVGAGWERLRGEQVMGQLAREGGGFMIDLLGSVKGF